MIRFVFSGQFRWLVALCVCLAAATLAVSVAYGRSVERLIHRNPTPDEQQVMLDALGVGGQRAIGSGSPAGCEFGAALQIVGTRTWSILNAEELKPIKLEGLIVDKAMCRVRPELLVFGFLLQVTRLPLKRCGTEALKEVRHVRLVRRSVSYVRAWTFRAPQSTLLGWATRS